ALPPNLLPDLLYFAEYSAAAYCDPNHVPGSEVTCPRNICPTIQKNSVTTAIEFSEGFADTTGIIALDRTTNSIVLAFRGSHSVRNWLTDFAAGLKSIPWCSGCKVHEGFYSAYMDEAAEIFSTIKSLKQANPTYRIVTTGHSLGGALAQLAAADLRGKGYQVTAYTYGSPRIGNDKLCSFISNQGGNYRVTHMDDPVPRLPLMLMGYQHVSPEYHITNDGGRASDINIVPGGINFAGNTADNGLVSMDIAAHLRYLIKAGIADCAPLEFELK
ncbi:alpha/beta-hydrolase, partial [Wilcoxina mikolae CBS 423.85]